MLNIKSTTFLKTMPTKTYIIAEIGNTHEGSLGLAKQFIKVASECGADAVKFQLHIFDAESLKSAPNPSYFKSESRKNYFERTSFSIQEWIKLKKYANQLKLDFLNSPFSIEAVDCLIKIGVDIYKIPSGELTNTPLLEKISKLNNKVYLSTGMSSWDEIDRAVSVFKRNKDLKLTIMQCTSMYPCELEFSGINVISEIRKRYKDVAVGFSDHTIGIAAPLAAVFNGATVIEKHLTLSRNMYGSDAKNATEPKEFKILVDEIRSIEKIMSSKVDKNLLSKKLNKMKKTFEKSIVASKDLRKGHKVTFGDLSFKKPGDGISASNYKKIIGKIIKKGMIYDEKFKLNNLL